MRLAIGSPSGLLLIAVLVAAPHLARRAQASTWLTAGGLGTMSVIDNDRVRGTVSDPQGYFHGGSALNAIAINDFVGAAYLNITRSERPPMILGQPPIVIISLSTKSVTGVVTDTQQLLTGDGSAQSLATSPDGRRLYYGRSRAAGGLEIVGIDTSTNDVVSVVPIDTVPPVYLGGYLWLSVDGTKAYMPMAYHVQGTDYRKLYAIDLLTGTSVGGVFLDHGPGTNTGLAQTPDGSTIFLSHGSEVLAIDAATFTATPVIDPGGALTDEFGLVVVGATLYVLVPDNANNDFVRVAMVDVATRTVVGNIQVASAPGAEELVYPIPNAFGASLDGTQIYVGYHHRESNLVPAVTRIAIIDPVTNTVVGHVEGADDLDLSVAVDPYLGLPIPLKCTLLKRKAAGKALLGTLKCHAKAKASGATVSDECLGNAERKLAVGFGKYPGACAGDPEAIDDLIDACAVTLLTDAPGVDACAVKSLTALGKGGSGRLLCAAKNIPKPGTAGACNAKQDEKTQKTLGKSGACVAPSTMDDLRACTASLVDALPVMNAP